MLSYNTNALEMKRHFVYKLLATHS